MILWINLLLNIWIYNKFSHASRQKQSLPKSNSKRHKNAIGNHEEQNKQPLAEDLQRLPGNLTRRVQLKAKYVNFLLSHKENCMQSNTRS